MKMGKLAFVMSGVKGGQVIEMDEKDFAKAERDGWAIDFEKANKGGDRDPFRGFNTDPHEHADAYLTARGLYPNREMRAQPPGTDTFQSPTSEPAKKVSIKPIQPEPDPRGDASDDPANPKPAAKPVKK
jgi:hypothetical protein